MDRLNPPKPSHKFDKNTLQATFSKQIKLANISTVIFYFIIYRTISVRVNVSEDCMLLPVVFYRVS